MLLTYDIDDIEILGLLLHVFDFSVFLFPGQRVFTYSHLRVKWSVISLHFCVDLTLRLFHAFVKLVALCYDFVWNVRAFKERNAFCFHHLLCLFLYRLSIWIKLARYLRGGLIRVTLFNRVFCLCIRLRLNTTWWFFFSFTQWKLVLYSYFNLVTFLDL